MLLIMVNGITMGVQTIPTLSIGTHDVLEIFDWYLPEWVFQG